MDLRRSCPPRGYLAGSGEQILSVALEDSPRSKIRGGEAGSGLGGRGDLGWTGDVDGPRDLGEALPQEHELEPERGLGRAIMAGWLAAAAGVASGAGRETRERRGNNSSNWKGLKNNNIGQRGSSNFTLAEQQIHARVDPIMKEVKRIIRESRDGIKLSEDDEMFIVEKILMYHPEKEKKMAGHNNYIMVAKHQKFQSSRCLYVVSSNGSTDFSYKKCLENMIRIHYPRDASSFCRKYFQ